ncbi:MAG: LPS-assembly protein LptD [Deltaproteobacteria bacterium]|nr:LPS-assembly protein LptD [Deltaproteobacteria bacterium]
MIRVLFPWLAVARAAEAEDALRVTADRIVVEANEATGDGNVHTRLGASDLTADRFRLDLTGGSLVLEGASFSPCVCPDGRPEPWSLSARRVHLTLGRRATFRGGLVRVRGCPVLPVPVGAIPLGPRRSGPRVPELAWTPDGPEIGEPVGLVLSKDVDLTIEPIWRRGRGFRLSTETRAALSDQGGLVLGGEGGWDARVGKLRGAARGQLSWARDGVRAAGEGEWISDASWPRDFGGDFLGRQLPFREIRAVAGVGSARLEHDGFQDPSGTEQRLVALVLSRPADGPTPLASWQQLSLAAVGQGDAPNEVDAIRAGAGAGVVAGRRIGFLETEAEAGIEAETLRDLEGSPPQGLGRLFARTRATLPLWRDGRSGRTILKPSLALEANAWGVVGEVETPPSLCAGPRLEAIRVEPGGMPLRVLLDLPVSEDGFAPEARAWARTGPWSANLALAGWPGAPTGNPYLGAGARWDDGVKEIDLQAIHLDVAPKFDQVWAHAAWTLPVRGDRWRPGARVRWSLASGSIVEVAGSMSFHSGCGCLDVRLEAAWAEDREGPDLRLALDLF